VKEGANVVVTGRREELGKQIVHQLNQIRSKSAIFVKLDVTVEGDWKNLIQSTVQSFGKLDILINNSGSANFAPIEASTLVSLKEMLATNVEGVYLGVKYGAEAMKKNSTGGSIVNITSVITEMVLAGGSQYGASKAAVDYFTRVAALEYASFNIRINSVAPGQTVTDMYDEVINNGLASKVAATKEEFLKLQAQKIPLKMLAEPEEITHPILFLASNEAKFITGITLPADGGMSLQFVGM